MSHLCVFVCVWVGHPEDPFGCCSWRWKYISSHSTRGGWGGWRVWDFRCLCFVWVFFLSVDLVYLLGTLKDLLQYRGGGWWVERSRVYIQATNRYTRWTKAYRAMRRCMVCTTERRIGQDCRLGIGSKGRRGSRWSWQYCPRFKMRFSGRRRS